MQSGDALLDGWMGAEEFLQKLPGLMCAEGIGDKEVRGRGGSSLHRRRVRADFLQCRGEAVGIASEERARGVGEKFSAARDGKLNELRGDGRENDRDDKADEHQGILIVSITSPKHRHSETNIGEHRDNADEDDCNRHHKNVSVTHVRELVRQNSLKLAPVHRTEKASRHRDRGMLFVATGREGIGCRVFDDIDPRLREPSSNRKIFDNAMQFEIFSFVGRFRTSGSYRNLV